jgi:hypothetical protein
MARPTIYSEEILEKAREYLEVLPEDEVIHSVEGLSDFLGVHRDTIYDWCSQDDKEEFSYIVNRMMMRQGKNLINGSLTRKLEPRTSGMMLGKHGYTTKTETDITTGGDKILGINYLTPNGNHSDSNTEAA